MTDDRQSIIDRIRAMRHTDGRSPAEAEAFMAKAAELAIEHQISEAELRGDHRTDNVGSTSKTYFVGNAAQGLFSLYTGVARSFGCAAIGYVANRPDPNDLDDWGAPNWKRAFRLTLFGTRADRDLVITLIDTVLLPQMMADVIAAKPRSRATFTDQWAWTVSDRIAAQLRRAHDRNGSAVIPVNPEITEMVQEATGGRTFDSPASDLSSYVQGAEAGRVADIGNPKLTTDPRPTIPAQPKQIGTGQ